MNDTAQIFNEVIAMAYDLADVGGELRFDDGEEPYASIPLDFGTALEVELAPYKEAARAMETEDPPLRGVVRTWEAPGTLVSERVVFIVSLEYGAKFARMAARVLEGEIRAANEKRERDMAAD